MKIVFTGGGSGGHFYPIIAVVEAIQKASKEYKLLSPKLYFFSTTPYNQGLLYDYDIEFRKTIAGKMRRYFSIQNFFDLFKTGWGSISAVLDLFDIYPDIVFGKGGYATFPTLLAARLLRIPVMIHESDSAPGRVNKWAGKFAKRVALSYAQAAEYFPAQKIAYTGQPILTEKLEPLTAGAHEFFEFEESIPTILIMGGSLGAEMINNAVLDSLVELTRHYQIIHQVGPQNIEVIKESAGSILLGSQFRRRYKPYGYLNSLELRMAAGAATLVISRAGSTIFEIASWGKPSIIIPIPQDISHDQTKNAFTYAAAGACSVIEEENLTPHIFLSEIKRIIENGELREKMSQSAKAFFHPGAADMIAKELLSIAMSHE